MQYFTRAIFATAILLVFVVASCNQAGRSDKNEKPLTGKDQATKLLPDTTSDLGFLKEYQGKYPNDVKLLENQTLKLRLQKLLGDRYAFLKETWAVETPIEIKNNIFVASGCQVHNCGSTNFMIVVDLSKGVVYSGIRDEEKVKLYAEDGTANEELNNWANNK